VPLLQKALDRSPPTWTTEDILNQVRWEQAQLFIALKERTIVAMATTQVNAYPLGTYLTIMQLASLVRFDDLFGFFDPIEEWAASNGCEYIDLHGRKGWVRRLKGLLFGGEEFKESSVHVIKPIGNMNHGELKATE